MRSREDDEKKMGNEIERMKNKDIINARQEDEVLRE